jgi:hypothetical protein
MDGIRAAHILEQKNLSRSVKKNYMRTLLKVMAFSRAKPHSVPNYALHQKKPAGLAMKHGMANRLALSIKKATTFWSLITTKTQNW